MQSGVARIVRPWLCLESNGPENKPFATRRVLRAATGTTNCEVFGSVELKLWEAKLTGLGQKRRAIAFADDCCGGRRTLLHGGGTTNDCMHATRTNAAGKSARLGYPLLNLGRLQWHRACAIYSREIKKWTR